MVTAANPITDEALLDDPNVVKAVLNLAGDALYFSRSRLPFPAPGTSPACKRSATKGFTATGGTFSSSSFPGPRGFSNKPKGSNNSAPWKTAHGFASS